MEKGAEHLAKFLKSCVEEMRLVAYALGKTDLAQLDRSDLVSVDPDQAQMLGVDYAGFPPDRQELVRMANPAPPGATVTAPEQPVQH